MDPVFLVGLGFIVGVLGGFFGVGGSFLAGPALFFAGMPMNMVVGTDLAHIVGKSIVAARKHRTLGNVDFKLGWIMVAGTIVGVEAGAQTVQALKASHYIDQVIGGTLIVILLAISSFMAWESIQTIRAQKNRNSGPKRRNKDHSVVGHISKAIHKLPLPPYISLPISGIPRVSLWSILLVGFVGGFFSGLLGGGAGYIRMPSLVYLLGVPTHIAVGTDLFEIIISAGYGTITHSLKGNVDILIALVMHTGAAIGAQIGATFTQFFNGPRLRLAFIPLPLIGAGLMLYSLLTGKGGH